jgi:acyl-CoA synthetase (AMP-forming)/AMP-acid ligase II
MLIYTSGTTAEPKGVLHTHESLAAELFESPTPPPDRPGTGTLQPFPAGHTAGVMSILGPAVHGCRTVLMDTWNADEAGRLIADYALVSMAGTPFFIATLLDLVEQGGVELPSLRDVLTGGASVPPVIIERADKQGWTVVRCYGSTEHPSLVAASRADPLHVRTSVDGRALGGAHIKIVDDEGARVPDGQAGEILVVGPEQFAGYTDPALNSASFDDHGWFRSGDIGVLENGLLRLVDRKKDIVIRGGENISAKEVEDVLLRHPAVEAAAVIGSPDPRYGERVFAFVVLRPDCTLELAEIDAHFAACGVARQKTPEGMAVVADLPRTAAGKVKKHELRLLLS